MMSSAALEAYVEAHEGNRSVPVIRRAQRFRSVPSPYRPAASRSTPRRVVGTGATSPLSALQRLGRGPRTPPSRLFGPSSSSPRDELNDESLLSTPSDFSPLSADASDATPPLYRRSSVLQEVLMEFRQGLTLPGMQPSSRLARATAFEYGDEDETTQGGARSWKTKKKKKKDGKREHLLLGTTPHESTTRTHIRRLRAAAAASSSSSDSDDDDDDEDVDEVVKVREPHVTLRPRLTRRMKLPSEPTIYYPALPSYASSIAEANSTLMHPPSMQWNREEDERKETRTQRSEAVDKAVKETPPAPTAEELQHEQQEEMDEEEKEKEEKEKEEEPAVVERDIGYEEEKDDDGDGDGDGDDDDEKRRLFVDPARVLASPARARVAPVRSTAAVRRPATIQARRARYERQRRKARYDGEVSVLLGDPHSTDLSLMSTINLSQSPRGACGRPAAPAVIHKDVDVSPSLPRASTFERDLDGAARDLSTSQWASRGVEEAMRDEAAHAAVLRKSVLHVRELRELLDQSSAFLDKKG